MRGRDATQAGDTQVWGVLNTTPDSFSDGGSFESPSAAVARARAMRGWGADVIDVGGASSRPRGSLYGAGAVDVPVDVELARVVPVIEALAREDGIVVSIDTTRAEVAARALELGARIVNDVGCARDPRLLEVVARSGAEYVVMHNRGRGETDGANVRYRDVIAETHEELEAALDRVRSAGIARERVWIDPGLGFAKTPEQSMVLLGALASLRTLGRVLVGASRKGFLVAGVARPNVPLAPPVERVGASVAAALVATSAGCEAVRVHDVRETTQALAVWRSSVGGRA